MITLNFKEYERVDELPEVTNPAIYTSNKHNIFSKDSLYSEQIFGPLKNYKCQCEKLFGRINAGEVCDLCEVECGLSDKRNSQFAKILLPEGIYIINPDFKNALQEVFGFNAIKNLLNKFQYNANKENPYFYSLSKEKLLRTSKISEKEIGNCLTDFPVFDINSLRLLFNFLKDDLKTEYFTIDDETGEVLEHPVQEDEGLEERYRFRHLITDKINYKYIKHIFINYILVTPPGSRQVIKISNVKIIPHPISKAYIEILKNISRGTSIMDNLYNANSDFFGNTVYKYQESVNAIYDEILQFNFQKTKNYVRESLTGKTIEFSQRAVIVPNPVLKPYQIGLPEESVKKLFLPELLRYLFLKYEENEIEIIEKEGEVKLFSIVEYIQYVYDSFDKNFEIAIPEDDLTDFLKNYISDFKMIVERQPNLYKWSMSGYMLARAYGDSPNEIIEMPELDNLSADERLLYFEAMQKAPEYVKNLIKTGSMMGKVFERNMKLAIQKIYKDKIDEFNEGRTS